MIGFKYNSIKFEACNSNLFEVIHYLIKYLILMFNISIIFATIRNNSQLVEFSKFITIYIYIILVIIILFISQTCEYFKAYNLLGQRLTC